MTKRRARDENKKKCEWSDSRRECLSQLLYFFFPRDLRVANVMADSVQLESWVSHGLTDGNNFAHENAVIILYVFAYYWLSPHPRCNSVDRLYSNWSTTTTTTNTWPGLFTRSNFHSTHFHFIDILRNTIRWPLIIDPEGFANKWIKSYEKENRLCVVQQSQADYLRVLENAIQYGLPVLVENVELDLDPIMEPILSKEVFRQSGSRFIKLGEKIVEYNDAFRCVPFLELFFNSAFLAPTLYLLSSSFVGGMMSALIWMFQDLHNDEAAKAKLPGRNISESGHHQLWSGRFDGWVVLAGRYCVQRAARSGSREESTDNPSNWH